MPNKSYFLGCPTPSGFLTHITEDVRSGSLFTYILKGGPGTGKSTLMKKIASSLDDAELYFCSSDPNSLDAVISRKKGIMVIDGTSPHVIDPIYPGVKQRLIDLGQFWDTDKLASEKDNIIKATDENKLLHARAKRYLKAATGLYSDILILGESAINRTKLDSYAQRLSQKIFTKRLDYKGNLYHRRITSITPQGIITQESAFDGCKTFYVDDSCIAVTDRLLKSLTVLAINQGHDVIVSTNPILPEDVYDHIVIPSINVAFSSKQLAGSQKINALRFYDRNVLREKKKRLQFAVSAGTELIKETVNVLLKAKLVHDELERYYISAMDFDALSKLTNDLIKEIGI